MSDPVRDRLPNPPPPAGYGHKLTKGNTLAIIGVVLAIPGAIVGLRELGVIDGGSPSVRTNTRPHPTPVDPTTPDRTTPDRTTPDRTTPDGTTPQSHPPQIDPSVIPAEQTPAYRDCEANAGYAFGRCSILTEEGQNGVKVRAAFEDCRGDGGDMDSCLNTAANVLATLDKQQGTLQITP